MFHLKRKKDEVNLDLVWILSIELIVSRKCASWVFFGRGRPFIVSCCTH